MSLDINNRFCKKHKIPMVYYSHLMTVACVGTAKDAGLDGNVICVTKLKEIAAKQ